MSFVKPSSFKLEMMSLGKDHLREAISLAMGDQKAVAFRKTVGNGGGESLVLLWSKTTSSEEVEPTPYPMGVDAVVELVWGWLEQAKYGPQPDFDGSAEHGWRIVSQQIGWSYAIFAITAEWALYGK